MIEHAVKTAALANGTLSDIEDSLAASSSITYGSPDAIVNEGRLSPFFKKELLPISTETLADLENIAAQKTKSRILFNGKKGSGIRDLTRHMAEKMSADTLEVSFGAIANPGPLSDPVSMLNNVFATAASSRALLVFTDMEAAVGDITQDINWIKNSLVNAFEKALEKHKLPVCVVNYTDKPFAEAFANNFDQHVNMKNLTPKQMEMAAKHYFEKDIDGQALSRGNYTLDDFNTIRRQANGNLPNMNSQEIIEKLQQRKEQREDGSVTLGFVQENTLK